MEQIFSFISGLLAGFPIIGNLVAAVSIKKGVRRTLAGVDDVVYYISLFLIAVSIVIAVLLIMSFFRFINKKVQRRKLYKVVTLLHRIQSDLVLLKGDVSLPEGQRFNIALSIKETIGKFRDQISDPFFQSRLGEHAFKRMMDAIDLIENSKMSIENQKTLIGQWLKTLDVLCR